MITHLVNRFIQYPGIAWLRTFDFLVQHVSSGKEIFEQVKFPFNKVLRDNRLVFLDEYNRMLKEKEIHNIKDFYKVDTDIGYDDNWKAAPLVLFNYLFKENAHRCPGTLKIISRLPGCRGAMFSVLGPGLHIPPHKGIYKGVYRCLLTLQVQQDAECWIRVNDQKHYFKEGETIVFDENIEHEVMNASTQPRVVLYLDFYRKLPFPLNVMNDLLFSLLRKSFFVTRILQEYAKLEKSTFEEFNSGDKVI